MAYVSNPNYGITPGAPQRLNWWDQNTFRMSDVLAQLRASLPPPPPTPPPMTSQETPQDIEARRVFENSPGRGAEPGGGGPGDRPGGIGPDVVPGGVVLNGRVSEPTAEMNAATYRDDLAAGRYATPTGPWPTVGALPGSPVTFNSPYGMIGSNLGMVAGTALGVPGLGLGLGILGESTDLARYVDHLRTAGINIHPDYGEAILAAGTSLPFGIGNVLGTSARQQFEDALRTNLADIGPTRSNTTLGPAPMTPEERARLELALPGMPSVGYVENPVPAFDPASLGRSYGYGAQLGSMEGVMGAPAGQTGYASGVYGSGVGAGESGIGADSVSGSGGVDPGGLGGTGAAAGGGDTGRDTGFFARGGLIGAPPGRYAAGGAVGRAGSLMPTRFEPPMMTPPRDYMSDADQRGARGLPPTGQAGERGELSPREQAIRDFMDDLYIARQRDMLPEQLARGGVVSQAAPDANITPAQFGLLRGVDPPGPDDQIGALQTGEGVITKRSMGKGWAGLLAPINAGKLDPAKVKGLLAAKPRARR